MDAIFDSLKYFQDHGGIILSVLLVGAIIEIRLYWIEKRSKDRDQNHETFYHNLELKKREGA